MSPIEALMQKRWILKSEDSNLYYEVKDSLKDIQKIMQEKLGYVIIVNPYLIKLEKIPGKAEAWMGIKEFTSVKEYQLFCYLLMFLEEKGREEQFVLASFTEFIEVQFRDGDIDWTQFSLRKQLIHVMKFALSQHLIQKYDGDEDAFAQDMNSEVLYENTGLSRYFLRNFMKEIMEYQTPQDFEQSDWFSMDEDRGIVRRQRIYRRLLLSPGVYRSEEDDDFSYIRNYRNQIQADFQSFFPCDLHIHSSSAYVNVLDDCNIGMSFPSKNTMSDLVLLVHEELRRRVKTYQIKPVAHEQLVVPERTLTMICEKVVQKDMEYLPKLYQVKGKEALASKVIEEMQTNGFLRYEEATQTYVIYPVVGKITGSF